MAVGVAINNLGNTSVANTNDLFIIGVYSEASDGQGNIVVSYDTQGITYNNLRTALNFMDLGDISVTEVAGVYGTETSLEYDANTGGLTYTKPYLLSNTEIKSLITAEDSKITVNNGVVGLGSVNTTSIAEGDNLYFTNVRASSAARSAISVSGSLAYNSSTGVISYTERTDDEILALFSGASGLTFDDSTGEISIGQDVSTTANVTFNSVVTSNLTANGVSVDNNTIKLSNIDSDWVGIINQKTGADAQRLLVGSGDNITGSGIIPQGGYTSWYGRSDTDYPGQIRHNVWDTTSSTSKIAGGFYSNGQMWGSYGANITGDMTVSGTISGTLDGTASDVESISNFSTDNLSEGTNNLYFTNARAVSALSSASTDDIDEGSRLYHTNARVTAVIEDTSINSLSDVDTTSGLAQGNLLGWDGSNWVPLATNDNLPIGTVQWYAGTSESVPAGWLECDGSQVTTTYPTLRQFLMDGGNPFGSENGNPLLPDLRGRFARGYDPSAINSPHAAIVGTVQDDTTKRHNHGSGSLSASSAGSHNHYTGLNPDNSNAFTFGGTTRGTGSARVDHNGGYNRHNPVTSTVGNHTHTISGSTANWPLSNEIGDETRPKNISFIPIIKAWGSILGANDLGVADIANLVNNIATQSEAEAGTNDTKFMSPLRTRQAIDNRVDSLTEWYKSESTNPPTSSETVWGGSTGTNASTLTGFSHKRSWNDGLIMKSCSVEGLKLNANYKSIWIDVGHFLYGYGPSQEMSWDHYPTTHTVQFEFTTAALGFAVGDRITLPTNSDHVGANEGNAQFFRVVNVSGTNRLRFYIYGHDNLGDIQGFGTRGVLYHTQGNFIVNMTKQGPIY